MTRSALILSLIFLFSGFSTFAQNQLKVDSLSALLLEAEGEERIPLLIEISKAICRSDPDQGHDYADEAIRLARQTDNTEFIYETMANKGYMYYLLFNDNEAIEQYQKAIEYCEEADYTEGKAHALYRIGVSYYYSRNYDESENYLNQSLSLAKELADRQLEGKIHNFMGKIMTNRNRFDFAIENFELAIEASTEVNDMENLSTSYAGLGNVYTVQGKFEEAIIKFEETKSIRLQLGNTLGAAQMDLFIGNCYTDMSRYNLALESYLAALSVFEEFNDNALIAQVYNGMAIIYEAQKFYRKAEEFYLKKLDINREMGDQFQIALTLNNLGITFSRLAADTIEQIYGPEIFDSITEEPTDKYLKYYQKGIDYFQQSLEISRELDVKQFSSQTLNNIGLNYLNSGKLNLAQKQFEQSLVLSEEIQDANELATSYLYLGQIAINQGRYDQALSFLNQSLEYAHIINVLDIMESIYLNMSSLYARMNNYRRALDYFKLHSAIRDTIKNKDMNQALADMQVRYETEALEKNNQLLMAQSQLDGAQIRQQRILIFFFIFVLLAISGMVVLLIRQSNQRKRTNLELSQKNALITEQKKEITDSIHYASRIQSALLPPGDYIDKLIPERFILYMPRDIVSGDYYWLSEKNGKVVCIAADCTGHGVPGAFMSMLGISFLNEIVSRHEDVHTDVILNELRAQVIKSLHQTGKEGGSQDGMDVALYILDMKNMTLEYSGANNSLFLLRNGKMIEIKADKMPIGIHTRAHEPFKRHNLDIQKGDMIYTFSDGYPDQFGGPHQKKFMIKNFKKLLAEICNDPVEAQKQALIDSLNSWMAETDQVDDIIVIGVRI